MTEKEKLHGCLKRVLAAEEALEEVRTALSEICGSSTVSTVLPRGPAVSGLEDLAESSDCSDKLRRCKSQPDQKCELSVTDDAVVVEAIQKQLQDDLDAELAASQSFDLTLKSDAKTMQMAMMATNSNSRPALQSRRKLCCFPMISPDNTKLLVWNAVGFIFMLYLLFALPVYLAFDVTPGGFLAVIALLADAYFILDLPLNFIIASIDHKTGGLLDSPGYVAKKYMKSWFVVDFISAVPWDLLANNPGQIAKGFRMLRFARAARFLRLFRMVKESELKRNIDEILESSPMLIFFSGLMHILVMVCGITHWGACAWYTIGTVDSDRPGWLEEQHLGDASAYRQYVYSLYFTLTTMTTVGYGDIVAKNYVEVCFVLVLLLVASVVFASLMGTLTDLISSLNASRHALEDKKRTLSQYMSWRMVPQVLARHVRQHLCHQWEANKGFAAFEEDLLNDLSPVLRKELCHHIYGKVMYGVPCLAWIRNYKVCMRDLANRVSSSFLSAGDYICHTGENNDEVYIVVIGRVLLSLNERVSAMSEVDETNAARAKLLALMGIPQKDEEIVSARRQDSTVLQVAKRRLDEQDIRERRAARFIQTRWRRNKMTLKRSMTMESQKRFGLKKTGTLRIRSTVVEAPACFGEACLWVPYEDWSVPHAKTFTYSARCETLMEMVVVPRDAIREVIERYSPWLRDRFEFFRQAVLDGIPPESRDFNRVRHAKSAPGQLAAWCTTPDDRCRMDLDGSEEWIPNDESPARPPLSGKSWLKMLNEPLLPSDLTV